jgi:hypothetical protein
MYPGRLTFVQRLCGHDKFIATHLPLPIPWTIVYNWTASPDSQ